MIPVCVPCDPRDPRDPSDLRDPCDPYDPCVSVCGQVGKFVYWCDPSSFFRWRGRTLAIFSSEKQDER